MRRYVSSVYSDTYLTTVGVKIDKKTVTVREQTLNLLLWDIAGEDDISALRTSYLRGAAGYLLVADGTRPETLGAAQSMQGRVVSELGPVPFVVLLNKHDLAGEWRISEHDVVDLTGAGWTVYTTSARTGEGVEAAFQTLAERTLG